MRADLPNNSIRKRVFAYYKDHLPLKRQSDLCVSGECIFCKICLNNGKYFLTCLSRSPTQGFDQFDSFSSNVSLTLSNIYVEGKASTFHFNRLFQWKVCH